MSSVLASESIKIKNVATMLANLENLQVQDDFKTLYSFNDEMFKVAGDAGKDVMLILGTRTSGEALFSDYVNFMKSYYGDSYAYYYKGHPTTPTGLDPEKQNLLESLGLTDVESSIAAELVLFFYPDIYLSGYPSSTFISVQNTDMACTLFNITKSSANISYASFMDIFISPRGSNYLVEYNDDSPDDLWNPDTKAFNE